MKEKIVENVLGYVKGSVNKGTPLKNWKLVLDKGLIWLENKKANLRIRGILNS